MLTISVGIDSPRPNRVYPRMSADTPALPPLDTLPGYQIRRLQQIIDPQQQPSLDSWLRVHGTRGTYALYFRDTRSERLVRAAPISKAS